MRGHTDESARAPRAGGRGHPRVRRLTLRALAGLVAVAGWSSAGAEQLAGRIQIHERGQPLGDLAGAWVWYEAAGGVPPRAPVVATVVTRNRKFSPRVLAVPSGSTVKFPNDDPVRHNVFSISTGNRFDLGLYGPGAGRSCTLKQSGLVRVFCNVHRSMSAFVLVLDTPFYAAPDTGGRFALAGLPAGEGTLHVWHPRAPEWTRAVRLPLDQPLEIVLDATLPPVPQHLNKFGRPYAEEPDAGEYR